MHFEDIRKLLLVINGLVDKGNTVIVIEHNLDVIKTSDWVIDMGPEGGSGGGTVVTEGTPEQIAAHPTSYTGQFLKGLVTPAEQPEPVASRRRPAAAPRGSSGNHPPRPPPAATTRTEPDAASTRVWSSICSLL